VVSLMSPCAFTLPAKARTSTIGRKKMLRGTWAKLSHGAGSVVAWINFAPRESSMSTAQHTMRPIQMVDLTAQYRKIQEEVDQAVLDVVRSAAFINGPEVKKFEAELAEYLDVKHVIGCANGTDALQIALMALDLKPGDEVITPSFTFVATVEVVALLGLKPV